MFGTPVLNMLAGATTGRIRIFHGASSEMVNVADFLPYTNAGETSAENEPKMITTTPRPTDFNPDPVRARAEQEYAASAELREQFIDADLYARACIRDAKQEHAATASQTPVLASWDELKTGWADHWAKNVDNCRATFLDSDLFYRTKRREQKEIDNRADLQRPE
jgi:hypothetical protein